MPRKHVLLHGVLADAQGEAASECIIRDIHARGAAISLERKLPIGAQVFLLDTGNGTAHAARVVWNRADRTGLSFVRSFAMGLGLPPRLKFLWRLLFGAKLRQTERALAAGISVELALGTVGLTRELIHQMARHAAPDERFRRLLLRAERLLDE
jgi:hypothetical protein